MEFDQKKVMSYPLHIRLINVVIKKSVNAYWTIIDIFSNKFPIISKQLYQRIIKDEYNLEHELLHLKKSDNILHIGCGIFPYSALLLSKKGQKKIVAIDTNKQAVYYAKELIQKKKLNGKIKIEIGDGAYYNLKPYSVIISSSCVDSTVKVLHNIVNHTKPNTRIIIRELPPMSKYLKKIINSQDNITLQNHYSKHSFPYYSIFRWDSFIIKKTK